VRLPSSVAGLGLCEAADLLEGYKSVASPIVSFVLGTTTLLLSAVNKFSRSDGLLIPLLCGKSTRCQPSPSSAMSELQGAVFFFLLCGELLS
jgi:hypothetical protein